MRPLALDDAYLVVMTGAGVSAESGIPTFRDANGLWEQHAIEDVASPWGFRRDPALVWRFYSQRRASASRCEPNAGHRALAAIERRMGERFLLLTQNVDGLHRKAGSKQLRELHGNLFTSRCSECELPPFEDARAYPPSELPRCACGALLRPHIVWFGEALDPTHFETYARFLETAVRRSARIVYLACGTSGLVQPAAGLVHAAKGASAETVLVNLEAPENVRHFDRVELGKSGDILPKLLGVESA
jgi:NAD-dependent deacetylase